MCAQPLGLDRINAKVYATLFALVCATAFYLLGMFGLVPLGPSGIENIYENFVLFYFLFLTFQINIIAPERAQVRNQRKKKTFVNIFTRKSHNQTCMVESI